MSIQKIPLHDSPHALQEAVEKEPTKQLWPWELLTMTLNESTPYIDETQF